MAIPAGDYFVMGDNRTDSADSRFFGPIPGSLIVGRVVAVVWPLSQWKGVAGHAPTATPMPLFAQAVGWSSWPAKSSSS